MSEEYIKSSKACVYVLGGSTSNSSLLDFDGVYILDGGVSEKATGFVAHVRNVSAVLLSAPTQSNLGTVGALVEQDGVVPVYTNTKPLKTAKPGSSGEEVKKIHEASAKLITVETPVFSPKYQPYIIYQSAYKGVLSLYVLAGDAKDAEAITKALASGNENEVEKAAAEHGTIGVLLWRPAKKDDTVIRVLISGTSSAVRIQQALDKAAKHLPFLNVANVKSKDALSDIPAPTVSGPRPAKPTAAARPTPPSSGTRPAAAPARAPLRPATTTAAPPARPTTGRPATSARAPTAAAKAPPAARVRPTPTSAPSAAAKKAAPPTRAAPAASRSSAESVAQKKTVGKVQGAAPSKSTAPAVGKKEPVGKAAPGKKPSPPPSVVAAPPVPVAPEVHLDDSVVIVYESVDNTSTGPMDIVVIPPTPEPPRVDEQTVEPKVEVEDVEPEIPSPVDAFKKPEPTPTVPDEEQKPTPAAPAAPEDEKSHEPEPGSPEVSAKEEKPEPVVPEVPKTEDVTPTGPVVDNKPEPALPTLDEIVPAAPSLIDFDPTPAHPEPSAPVVPADHVIISSDDPSVPDVAAAVPFVPQVPGANDGLITLDDEHVAPGFEEPLIPQAPKEDGTLADCSEEVSKLVEISMDTEKSTAEANITNPIGEITQLSSELNDMKLNDATNEYVRKLSNQMIQDATLPFTSALASSIVGEEVTSPSNGINGGEKPLVDFDSNGHNGSVSQKEEPTEASKHDLMQSRSSVIENGSPVQYEKTDPAIDDILAACANESDKLDAVHSEVLHLPDRPGVPIAKSLKFARPYYFDLVTMPHNSNQELTGNADTIQEFAAKLRSRNLIMPSKDISAEQLNAIVIGKQYWVDSAHPCTVIPTHTSPILVDFRSKNEERTASLHLSFVVPVDKQRTTVNSAASEAVEYQLATLPLRE